jgi:hypothetical protein
MASPKLDQSFCEKHDFQIPKKGDACRFCIIEYQAEILRNLADHIENGVCQVLEFDRTMGSIDVPPENNSTRRQITGFRGFAVKVNYPILPE